MPDLSKDWTLEFAPETGGAVKSCQYQGHEILRTAVSHRDPREMSAFPMVPFIGRITNRKFIYQGNRILLNPNMPPEPHAIHGRGWQTPWTMETDQAGAVWLSHIYDGDGDWPWAYRAEQRFSALGKTLMITLSLTNTSKTTMPAGLGWHPYFPRTGAVMKADVLAVWSGSGADNKGYGPQPLTPEIDLRKERPVTDLALDHCFTAGAGDVRLDWPTRGLSLDISASALLRHLTVYVPPGEDYFCVEPVSHAPDAVNSHLPRDKTGLNILQPSETLEAEIAFSVTLDAA